MIPSVRRWEAAEELSGAKLQPAGTLDYKTCRQPNRELKLANLKPEAKPCSREVEMTMDAIWIARPGGRVLDAMPVTRASRDA